MNILFIIKVQDGENQRYEYQCETLRGDDVHKSAINTRGEEINRERFTGDLLSGNCYWDEYSEIAGEYSDYKVIPCNESFEIMKSIIY